MTGGTAVSKLNLYLKVTARRADGYHELQTLFYPVAAIADRLWLDVAAAPGVTLNVANAPALAAESDNLVLRAARAYAAAAGLEPSWHFMLEKNVPIAAGMGGGSSDAACALRLLNAEFRRLSRRQLAEIAVGLGADVPYFLAPATGFATGIGEHFTPFAAEPPPLPLLLINPRFPVSAKWAYTHLAPERIGPDAAERDRRLAVALQAGDLAGVAANLHNDLATALYEKFPLLALLRDFACENGALQAEITGSGPTLYALLPAPEAIPVLAEKIRGRFGSDTLTLLPVTPPR